MKLWQPWSLRDLTDELAAGVVTAVDAMNTSRARIAATEPTVRAWVEFESEPPALVPTGLLAGIPFGVKDIIDVAGLPTRCGSQLRAAVGPAPRDAQIVSAWTDAGAIVVGKTVTTEYAYFAPGPTGNPAAPGHTPGGSSSGSAAAVAAGQVPLAIGSQTAGSVTRPAAYCGVASLVMSLGRVPMNGVTGLSSNLDSHGVFTATVSDMAFAWSALTGGADPGLRVPNPPKLLRWSADPLAIVEPEMNEALRQTEAALVSAGAQIDPFPFESMMADVALAHPIVMAYDAARERVAELQRADRLSAPLRELLERGAQVSDDEYWSARSLIEDARARVEPLLKQYDAVLGPAASAAAPRGLAATGNPGLSRPWQGLGLPQLAVPGLRNATNRPLGIQLIAGHLEEDRLLEVGCWVECCVEAELLARRPGAGGHPSLTFPNWSNLSST